MFGCIKETSLLRTQNIYLYDREKLKIIIFGALNTFMSTSISFELLKIPNKTSSHEDLNLRDLTAFGIIRIYHEFEDGIEKSVMRITDWHHEACRVMTNGDR